MSFHGWRFWLATAGAPPIEHAMHPPRTFKATGGANVRVEFEYSEDRNRVLRGLPPRRRRTPG